MSGHVIGRFQPFHREHAKYVKWACDQCDTLIFGIANADPSHIAPEATDTMRHKEERNPYTYFERLMMIDAFAKMELDHIETKIAPFPINKPELWDYYVPESVTHYVNVVDPWDQEKVDRLRQHGHDVVSKTDDRSISGTDIRNKMRNNGNWEQYVPSAVVKVIKGHDMQLE